LGAAFSDDADEVAEHVALGGDGAVGGVDGLEDVGCAVVLEEFYGDEIVV